MRKFTAAATLSMVGLLALPVFADVTKEDLKKLAAAGISEEVILSYIKANGPVSKLSVDDLVELKNAGLTEKVLAAAAAPPPVSPQVVENRSYYSTPSYGSPSPYYSSYYSPYRYSSGSYYPSYYYPSYSHLHPYTHSTSHSFGHHGVTHSAPSQVYHGHRGATHSGGHHGGSSHGGGHHRGGGHGGHR